MNRQLRRLLLSGAVWCASVAPLAAQPVPHAAHGARFGGAFLTTAADTLHAEAIWSEQRRFRLFVVDASGAPLGLDRLRSFDGRVVTGDGESPLLLLEAEGYFEARIPTQVIPAAIDVRLTLAPERIEERLSFVFSRYSPDLYGIAGTAPAEIPGTLAGIISAIADDRRAAQDLLAQGEYLALAGFEDRTRDRTLAIEPYLTGLSPESRAKADAALTAVVRACWLLHTAIDYGDVPQRQAAFKQVSDAFDHSVTLLAGITP